jgi:predicted nucleic acid-binding protein
VRFFFDTSVLLPCFFENHIYHEASLRVFLEANKEQSCCGAHSLAELYANATRLPGKNRLGGDQALLFIDEVRDRLAIVALTPEEYYSTISDAAAEGIVGGTIYDALLCRCAVKAEAELIYTWNVRHFQQFSEDIAKRLRTP